MTTSLSRLTLALALALGACGADDTPDTPDTPDAALADDGGGPGPDAGPPDGPGEPLINGEPASAFYDRFVFQTTMTHNAGAAAFPLTDGKNIYLVEFYLLASHDYLMFYSDGDGVVRGDGTYSIAVAPADMRRLTGTWQVTGSKLRLGSLLACDGLALDGRPALQCRIVTPPGSPGAPQGIAAVAPYGLPTDPGSSRWDDFH